MSLFQGLVMEKTHMKQPNGLLYASAQHKKRLNGQRMFSLPVHSTVKFLWLLLCFYNTTITLICLFSSFLSRHSTLTYFKTFSPILLLPLFSLNSSSSSFLPLVLIPRDQLITLKKKNHLNDWTINCLPKKYMLPI